MPRVSVIVPVYNAAPYLEACAASILRQTEGDLELLLIDDGSTDGSGPLCRRLAGDDPRVRVVRQGRQGASAARNRGLALARGGWVMFVDADDWLEPDALEQLLPWTDTPHCSLVVGEKSFDTPGRSRVRTPCRGEARVLSVEQYRPYLLWAAVCDPPPERMPPALRCLPQLGSPVARLYETAFLRRSGIWFPVSLRSGGEDRMFNLEVVAKSRTICYVDTCIYHYRLREGSCCHGPARLDPQGYVDRLKTALEKTQALGVGVEAAWGVEQYALDLLHRYAQGLSRELRGPGDFGQAVRRLRALSRREPFSGVVGRTAGRDCWTVRRKLLWALLKGRREETLLLLAWLRGRVRREELFPREGTEKTERGRSGWV